MARVRERVAEDAGHEPNDQAFISDKQCPNQDMNFKGLVGFLQQCFHGDSSFRIGNYRLGITCFKRAVQYPKFPKNIHYEKFKN